MGILDNIVSGIKGFMGNKGNIGAITTVDPTQTPQPVQGGVTNTPVQNPVNPVVNGVNQARNNGAIGGEQEQTNPNRFVNAIKNSQLRPSNWSDGTRQTVSNILFGIGRSATANPNGDVLTNILNGVNSGVQNQINYKNAVNSMQQNGIDVAGLSPYADYSDLTWDKIQDIGIKQKQNQIRIQQNQISSDIANAKDNTARLKLILDALKNNTIEPEEAQAQAKLYGIDFGNMQSSNTTNRTNSYIETNEARKDNLEAKTQKIKKETEYVGKPKVTVNVRQGGTKSTVEHKHTGGSGGSSKPKLLY